ncbi:MAG: amidase [Geothrix sp.]|uniref:amidase n=1 Tax=Geothrix sp. TaxID=1962974 RepID=UPI0018453D81|nr:amidase [Geothrix sp.]NWJ40231.1 amidase [Geothrix sp.]WIL21763.1 MAG: amidase [Geothrix sp.]
MTRHPDSPAFDRRTFLGAGLAMSAGALMGAGRKAPAAAGLVLEEASIEYLQAGLAGGRWTSVDLVRRYQARIRALDQSGPKLNSVIELNPEALAIAQALDAERKAGKPRGPLHGIPVLIKDNIDTADRMKTTAGSLALAEAPAPREDAFIVAKLREAGAVVLGKTNLSEWANLRSTRSSSGWSGRGGQTRNPYALDRSPSGSSSGSGAATAASLCAAAVGTETDGSVVSPANANGLVGLKPTVGLLSRSGIIPISHTQDTAGPMTRTVRDAALLLGAMAGTDSRDAATREADARRDVDYTRFLAKGGLKGARLGVVKNLLGVHAHVDAVILPALETLKAQGATLVDVELKSAAYDDAEFEVLLYEFKADLNAYLGGRGGAVEDLTTLMAFNEQRRQEEMPFFGQELLQQAQAKGPLTDAAYLKALDTCAQARRDITGLLEKHQLQALVGPTGGPAWLIDHVNGDSSSLSFSSPAAVAGCPHLTVPAGFAFGLPVGLSFVGGPWQEGILFRLAFAFEQTTRARRAPRFPATAAVPR